MGFFRRSSSSRSKQRQSPGPRSPYDAAAEEAQNPEEFATQVSTLIPAEIRMISGCHSEQTSADVRNCATFGGLPNAAGKAGGACTSALLELLYEDESKTKWTKTFQDLLLELRARLAQKGFGDQVPQLSSSRPLELQQTLFSLTDGPGTCRALLVGINYQGQSGELSGCHNDVRNVKRYLIERQGYEERNILMLLDDGTHILPTRQKIILGLKQLVSYSQPGDNVYFHYSGHGGLLEPGASADNGGFFNTFKQATASTTTSAASTMGGLNKDYEETLFPVDHESAGQIRDFSLFHHFVQPMKAGVTVTCVLDCCHSGTVLNLPYQFQPTPSGEIRSRQCVDSLSNLAFLYLLAGNADLALMGGGVLAGIAENLGSRLNQDLDYYQGLGMQELFTADQMDDTAFAAEAAQYFLAAGTAAAEATAAAAASNEYSAAAVDARDYYNDDDGNANVVDRACYDCTNADENNSNNFYDTTAAAVAARDWNMGGDSNIGGDEGAGSDGGDCSVCAVLLNAFLQDSEE